MSPEAVRLVEDNMRFVHYLVRKHFRCSPLEYDDLVQEGMIRLIEAANKYQPDRGVKFATFASVCIYNKICNALRKSRRARIIPANRMLSFDAPVHTDVDACLTEIIPDTSVSVETQVEQRMDARQVMALIGMLPEMERRALELTVFDELRQIEVAQIMGCSQTHVSRRVRNARARLSRMMAKGVL